MVLNDPVRPVQPMIDGYFNLRKIIGLLLLSILPVLAGVDPPGLYCAPQLDNQMYVNLRRIAQAFERSGRIEEAILLLSSYREDSRILSILCRLYGQAGRKQESLDVAREVLLKNPDSNQILATYFQALDGMGFRDSIRVAVSAYLERSEENAVNYLFTGSQLRRYGMFEDALDVYLKGRKRLGDEEIFSSEIGQTLIDLKRYGPALDELVAFLSTSPGATALVQREVYRIKDSGDSGAELVLKRLAKALEEARGPFRVSLLKLLVDLNLASGRGEQALWRLDELLGEVEKKEGYRQLNVFIGRCLKNRQFETALGAFGLADSLELMDKGTIILSRSGVLLRMEKYGQAESFLLELVSSDNQPDGIRVEAMSRLGDIYLDHLGKPDEALRWFREVERLDRAKGKLLLNAKKKIVESFIRSERLNEAAKLCGELLAQTAEGEDQADLLKLFADILFYRGQPDSAAVLYKSFAGLRLSEPEANDVLELVYLIQTDISRDAAHSKEIGDALFKARCGKVQDAAGVFAEMLSEVADSVYLVQIYYQMGNMYERAGEFSLALGVYGEIVKSYPESHMAPLAELRMGLVLLESAGDRAGARRHFERIVYEYPAGVATPRARRLLRSLEEQNL